MADIVGEIMLAIGDINFLSKNTIGAIGLFLSAGPQGSEIGSRLRLGEIHCAHPLTRNQFGQIG